jgi:predicted RNase H-related nuclease YkuK (DUF458 family)
MEYFSSENRGVCEDIFKYISDKMFLNDSLEIFLAIDSKRRKLKTSYVVTIVLYSPKMRNGAEVWFRRIIEKTPPDMFTRLWREVEFANEWSEKIWNNLKSDLKSKDKLNIHLDLNTNPKAKSYKVYKASSAWITSLGFNVKFKPDSWACRASDYLA